MRTCKRSNSWQINSSRASRYLVAVTFDIKQSFAAVQRRWNPKIEISQKFQIYWAGMHLGHFTISAQINLASTLDTAYSMLFIPFQGIVQLVFWVQCTAVYNYFRRYVHVFKCCELLQIITAQSGTGSWSETAQIVYDHQNGCRTDGQAVYYYPRCRWSGGQVQVLCNFFLPRAPVVFLAGQELITTWFVPNRTPSDLEPQSAHLSCKRLVHFFSQCPVCLVSVILEHNTSYIPFLLYRRKLQLLKAI